MGVKKTLFGAPAEQSSSSGNQAYGDISTAFKPALGYVTQGGNMVSALLGGAGGDAQKAALENYSNSGGMQFLREQGMKGITSSKAASGLLQSGSYGTALAKYNQGLASTYLNQYMDHAMDLGKLGIGAGGVLASAGQESESEGTGAKKGIMGDIIKAGMAVASGGASAGAGA